MPQVRTSTAEPDFALPAARTEYMTVRGRQRETYFSQQAGEGGAYVPLPVIQTGSVACTAGSTCADRWNAAVIGPGLAPVRNDAPSIGRAGDGTISAEPQLSGPLTAANRPGHTPSTLRRWARRELKLAPGPPVQAGARARMREW
ncbi:hypothetical protein [Streptomyces atratus]|uniref:hypothetical protein n=1 Tax=Streptomyces atratus TaxID=1893 RepID=UPI0033EA6471